MDCQSPDKDGNAKAVFTRKPMEGMPYNLTEDALAKAASLLGDKYLFKR